MNRLYDVDEYLLCRAGGGRVANISVTIGAEHDDAVLARLHQVFAQLGARRRTHLSGMAGSQEWLAADYMIGSVVISVKVETYIGIILSGDQDVIDRIVSRVQAE